MSFIPVTGFFFNAIWTSCYSCIMYHPLKSEENFHIKILDLVDHQLHDRMYVKSAPVRPVGAERRKHIAHPQYPRSQRSLLSGKIRGITASVIILMVIKYTYHDKIRLPLSFQLLVSQRGMHAHIFQFLDQKRILLSPVDISGKPQLPDIMKHSGDCQLITDTFFQSHL